MNNENLKNSSCSSTVEENNFKPVFKFYKKKDPLPTLDDVIDVRKKINSQNVENVKISDKLLGKFSNDKLQWCGLKDVQEWKVYQIAGIPGLLWGSDVFTQEGQRYWCERCLKDFPREPNKANLKVNHTQEQINNCYAESLKKFEDEKKSEEFVFKFRTQKRQVKFLKECPIWNLRWSTLGYHHNWETKHYAENSRSEFPKDLSETSKIIADIFGFPDFKTEAGVINFYHVGCRLSPHNDVSEPDKNAPLISISLGRTAIFLIGGHSLADPPKAILLHSGDVLIMSKESRLAYHAVPAILPLPQSSTEIQEDFVSLYMQHSRINMNVRQVGSLDHISDG